ncbi:Crp/Fnr family transcriptional regulator [Robiginitomaculum antarcticum]|uniref:Crp/Fnr family transcriptional regulator n=1 Tax=Robiginitomaculum antarcticum TaxID=437507 RepID=UPI000360964E|nr:Crp/Fnr family transcriptional regulator [Robiginitomaculum antarcticum]
MIDLGEHDWYSILEERSVRKSYQTGDIIRFQGQAPQNVGIVMSGRASAVSYSANGDETWIGEYTQGHFIGMVSFLAEEFLDFELHVETDLELRLMPVDTMRDCLASHAGLSHAVAKDLAHRLGLTMSDLVSAHTLSVKGRVCAELIRLASPIGIDPDKQIIRPNPIFVELARRVNSTRETVSRTVNELQKMGLVSRVPGALIVQNPERLRAVFA